MKKPKGGDVLGVTYRLNRLIIKCMHAINSNMNYEGRVE